MYNVLLLIQGNVMKKIKLLLLMLIFSLPLMAERADLSWIQSWGYQLQDVNLSEVEASTNDVMVIDYSKSGDDESAFSPEEIASLQASGKIVLAYLSIGEAEDYRFYWKEKWNSKKPAFLEEENPDWAGNYKVKYWYKAWWKKALRPYLDKIMAAGFDGVYLDIIDGYYYFGEKENKMRTRANQMVKLVEQIANYTRTEYGEEFIVSPQNGLAILDDCSKKYKQRYLTAIDAVGVESLYYNTYSEEDKNYRIEKLAELSSANKLILNVEYIDATKYDEYYNTWENSNLNIVGYPADADTALDELVQPFN